MVKSSMSKNKENIQSFAQQSSGYAANRPTYPNTLFTWINDQCANHNTAWDCATGNGQAAQAIAPYFDTVHATDISAEQVAHGLNADNVRYRAAPAEDSGFRDSVFDLVTVAQALHWFDHPRFWKEVKRVAKTNAFFCAWAYVWPNIDDMVRDQFIDPIKEMVDPYWAEGNRIVMRGYQPDELKLPFEPIAAPAFEISLTWRFEQLLGFVETWSAYKIAEEKPIAGDIQAVITKAKSAFSGQSFDVSMPIHVLAAHIR